MNIERSSRSAWVFALIVGAIALIGVLARDLDSSHIESRKAGIDQPEPRLSEVSGTSISPDLASNAIGENLNVPQSDQPRAEAVSSNLEDALTWAREETAKEVLVAYSLMFKHLRLTEAEKIALIDFLVEVGMSETRMRNYHPAPIEEKDRQAGIAAIIGDAKLDLLLELEQNRSEYEEATLIDIMFREKNASLSASQQDRLLNVLIQVRGSEQAVANQNAQHGTIDAIESQMDVMNEYERLVLELAPSVLSSRQMELLFGRYQALSYRRAEILEMQKKSRANDTEEDDFPLGYPPRN